MATPGARYSRGTIGIADDSNAVSQAFYGAFLELLETYPPREKGPALSAQLGMMRDAKKAQRELGVLKKIKEPFLSDEELARRLNAKGGEYSGGPGGGDVIETTINNIANYTFSTIERAAGREFDMDPPGSAGSVGSPDYIKARQEHIQSYISVLPQSIAQTLKGLADLDHPNAKKLWYAYVSTLKNTKDREPIGTQVDPVTAAVADAMARAGAPGKVDGKYAVVSDSIAGVIDKDTDHGKRRGALGAVNTKSNLMRYLRGKYPDRSPGEILRGLEVIVGGSQEVLSPNHPRDAVVVVAKYEDVLRALGLSTAGISATDTRKVVIHRAEGSGYQHLVSTAKTAEHVLQVINGSMPPDRVNEDPKNISKEAMDSLQVSFGAGSSIGQVVNSYMEQAASGPGLIGVTIPKIKAPPDIRNAEYRKALSTGLGAILQATKDSIDEQNAAYDELHNLAIAPFRGGAVLDPIRGAEKKRRLKDEAIRFLGSDVTPTEINTGLRELKTSAKGTAASDAALALDRLMYDRKFRDSSGVVRPRIESAPGVEVENMTDLEAIMRQTIGLEQSMGLVNVARVRDPTWRRLLSEAANNKYMELYLRQHFSAFSTAEIGAVIGKYNDAYQEATLTSNDRQANLAEIIAYIRDNNVLTSHEEDMLNDFSTINVDLGANTKKPLYAQVTVNVATDLTNRIPTVRKIATIQHEEKLNFKGRAAMLLAQASVEGGIVQANIGNAEDFLGRMLIAHQAGGYLRFGYEASPNWQRDVNSLYQGGYGVLSKYMGKNSARRLIQFYIKEYNGAVPVNRPAIVARMNARIERSIRSSKISKDLHFAAVQASMDSSFVKFLQTYGPHLAGDFIRSQIFYGVVADVTHTRYDLASHVLLRSDGLPFLGHILGPIADAIGPSWAMRILNESILKKYFIIQPIGDELLGGRSPAKPLFTSEEFRKSLVPWYLQPDIVQNYYGTFITNPVSSLSKAIDKWFEGLAKRATHIWSVAPPGQQKQFVFTHDILLNYLKRSFANLASRNSAAYMRDVRLGKHKADWRWFFHETMAGWRARKEHGYEEDAAGAVMKAIFKSIWGIIYGDTEEGVRLFTAISKDGYVSEDGLLRDSFMHSGWLGNFVKGYTNTHVFMTAIEKSGGGAGANIKMADADKMLHPGWYGFGVGLAHTMNVLHVALTVGSEFVHGGVEGIIPDALVYVASGFNGLLFWGLTAIQGGYRVITHAIPTLVYDVDKASGTLSPKAWAVAAAKGEGGFLRGRVVRVGELMVSTPTNWTLNELDRLYTHLAPDRILTNLARTDDATYSVYSAGRRSDLVKGFMEHARAEHFINMGRDGMHIPHGTILDHTQIRDIFTRHSINPHFYEASVGGRDMTVYEHLQEALRRGMDIKVWLNAHDFVDAIRADARFIVDGGLRLGLVANDARNVEELARFYGTTSVELVKHLVDPWLGMSEYIRGYNETGRPAEGAFSNASAYSDQRFWNEIGRTGAYRNETALRSIQDLFEQNGHKVSSDILRAIDAHGASLPIPRDAEGVIHALTSGGLDVSAATRRFSRIFLDGRPVRFFGDAFFKGGVFALIAYYIDPALVPWVLGGYVGFKAVANYASWNTAQIRNALQDSLAKSIAPAFQKVTAFGKGVTEVGLRITDGFWLVQVDSVGGPFAAINYGVDQIRQGLDDIFGPDKDPLGAGSHLLNGTFSLVGVGFGSIGLGTLVSSVASVAAGVFGEAEAPLIASIVGDISGVGFIAIGTYWAADTITGGAVSRWISTQVGRAWGFVWGNVISPFWGWFTSMLSANPGVFVTGIGAFIGAGVGFVVGLPFGIGPLGALVGGITGGALVNILKVVLQGGASGLLYIAGAFGVLGLLISLFTAWRNKDAGPVIFSMIMIFFSLFTANLLLNLNLFSPSSGQGIGENENIQSPGGSDGYGGTFSASTVECPVGVSSATYPVSCIEGNSTAAADVSNYTNMAATIAPGAIPLGFTVPPFTGNNGFAEYPLYAGTNGTIIYATDNTTCQNGKPSGGEIKLNIAPAALATISTDLTGITSGDGSGTSLPTAPFGLSDVVIDMNHVYLAPALMSQLTNGVGSVAVAKGELIGRLASNGLDDTNADLQSAAGCWTQPSVNVQFTYYNVENNTGEINNCPAFNAVSMLTGGTQCASPGGQSSCSVGSSFGCNQLPVNSDYDDAPQGVTNAASCPINSAIKAEIESVAQKTCVPASLLAAELEYHTQPEGINSDAKNGNGISDPNQQITYQQGSNQSLDTVTREGGTGIFSDTIDSSLTKAVEACTNTSTLDLTNLNQDLYATGLSLNELAANKDQFPLQITNMCSAGVACTNDISLTDPTSIQNIAQAYACRNNSTTYPTCGLNESESINALTTYFSNNCFLGN